MKEMLEVYRNITVNGMIYREEGWNDNIEASEVVNGLIFTWKVDFLTEDVFVIIVGNGCVARYNEACLDV